MRTGVRVIDCDVRVSRDPAVGAAAFLRQVAGEHLGLDPRDVLVERHCAVCGGPHGKPGVAGLELSLSHCAGTVVVAVCADAPVGVDVEAVRGRPDLDRGVRAACTAGELAGVRDERDLLRLWTRKEAVVKATGEGLTVPLRDVHVSSPLEPARLLSWSGRPSQACTLLDLDLPADLVGSLAVLTAAPVSVSIRPTRLLAAPTEALR
jgi:4'-phosphopantetheinyl transferase